MEPYHAATQVFSLRHYVQLYLDGTIAVDPYCYLIVWLQDEGQQPMDAENTFCLHQPHYALLRDLGDKDGYVLSFPVHYFDSFTGAGVPAFFNNQFYIGAFTVAEDCRSVLEILQQEIVREVNRRTPNPLRDEMLKALLKILIIRISYESGKSFLIGEQAGDVDFSTKFFELIKAHFVGKKKVTDYSEMMHISPNYLNARIKQITGYSAGYHIRQRVAVEAKRLALQHRLLAKEVAYELGYTDIAHFSKCFKNLVGVSFTHYQRQHCQWPAEGRR
jgi:AraC-like DNA-binding protein